MPYNASVRTAASRCSGGGTSRAAAAAPGVPFVSSFTHKGAFRWREESYHTIMPPQPAGAPGEGPPGARPRLLVCHDHRGGYTEDRWALGSAEAGAFRINAWHCVDAFVYFSHLLVSIPPPGWINAAHRNGVPVKPLKALKPSHSNCWARKASKP